MLSSSTVVVTTAASLSAKSAKQFVFILQIFIGFFIKSNVNSLYFSKKNFLFILPFLKIALTSSFMVNRKNSQTIRRKANRSKGN